MDNGINSEVVTLPVCTAQEDIPLALDIGGSLAKLVYVSGNSPKSPDGLRDTKLHLLTFDVNHLDECLQYIKHNIYNCRKQPKGKILATGVGCVKFREKINTELGVELEVDTDELSHTARGVAYLWRHLSPDKLLYESSDISGLTFQTSLPDSGLTPYILVNLGSALTIIEVKEDGEVSGLVGGSSQGGLTFLGLGALLTGAKDHRELMDLASQGDRKNIDLFVKDTAGSDYNVSPSDSMVSSFGKVAKERSTNQDARFRDEDVASSLLYCITDQLAASAYLVAKCQGVSRIVFCGSYIAGNYNIISQIQDKLTTCSLFLKVSSVFVKYEGHIGAIGLLSSQCLGSHSQNGSHRT